VFFLLVTVVMVTEEEREKKEIFFVLKKTTFYSVCVCFFSSFEFSGGRESIDHSTQTDLNSTGILEINTFLMIK
jgi:hypothetical protein